MDKKNIIGWRHFPIIIDNQSPLMLLVVMTNESSIKQGTENGSKMSFFFVYLIIVHGGSILVLNKRFEILAYVKI